MLARVYTTWRPDEGPMTPEQHRASLEARWRGGAMNVKQMFEAMGGALALTARGTGVPLPPSAKPPGIGPFPGRPG